MFGPCFIMHYLVSFLVLQSSRCGREPAGCLTYLFLCCHLSVGVLCIFPTVPWVSLQCATVAFPGHSHLLFMSLLCGRKVWYSELQCH